MPIPQSARPEATAAALSILRNPTIFQWYVIPLLAVVIYIYANEIQNKRWNVIAAGLALYVVHWFVEIINALIQHFTGHALWTVPTGTAFLLLIGVGVEISLMFSIAGLALSKLLPPDPKVKIFGVNNRDLRTFEVRVDTSLELIEEIPDECIAVSESGLRTNADLLRLRGAADEDLVAAVETVIVHRHGGLAFARRDAGDAAAGHGQLGPRARKRFGRRLGISMEKLERMEQLLHKHAPIILFFSKLTVSPMIPALIATGLIKYPWKRWFPYVFAGEMIWTGSLVVLGYFGIQAVKKLQLGLETGILIGSIIFIITILLLGRHYLKKETQQSMEEEPSKDEQPG